MKPIVFLALVVACVVTPCVASADWDIGDSSKWVQYPDLELTGADVNATAPYLLADDFLCSEPGPITDFHIWGSWYQDRLPYGADPNAVVFTISIHADIPAEVSPTGHSMPGDVLWYHVFQPGAFSARVWADGLQEGWLEPPDYYEPNGDTVCWQYNFVLSEADAFMQEGTPEQPRIYWIDVQAQPQDAGAYFGWKTSLDHWNDDATWVYGDEPYQGNWGEMIYPIPHPMAGDSVDLAFVITGEVSEEMDYGDAPDPSYPTLRASSGAAHVVIPGYCLGALIDAEPDGQPTLMADGDDMNNAPDEDGVTFITMPLQQSQPAQVDVVASAPGVLDAWIDFDHAGGWDDGWKRIFTAMPLNAGLNSLTFNVPVAALPGPTYARFRFSQNGVVTFSGTAPDGEVEDYMVEIVGEDWKWIQPPELEDTGIDVDATEPYILADDYLCTSPGRVDGITIWGSWLDDHLPFGGDPWAVDFTLSIHEDVMADTLGNPSHPGDVLWYKTFPAGSFIAEVWRDGIVEGWQTPPDEYIFPADWTCWRYTFNLGPEEAFHQVGMPDRPIVYWLDVKAVPQDDGARFGWKTSNQHWGDDATWAIGLEPHPGVWTDLRYPPQHPNFPMSIDLAFALTSTAGTDVPGETESRPRGALQNAPNPFNPKTTIRYEVPAGGGHVTIEIYDVNGRHVRTLVDREQASGEQSVVWDGRDDGGRLVATGVYLYRMTAPGIETASKMLLLK